MVLAEERRANQKPEQERTAYDLDYLAFEQLSKYEEAATARAVELLQQALALEPDYGFARANLARAYYRNWENEWGKHPIEDLESAFQNAWAATRINGADYWPQWMLGVIYRARGDLERSWAAYQRAFDLNPDVAQLQSDSADTLGSGLTV